MLYSFTLYFASIAVMVVMTLLNFLTWRTNKHTPGTLLYIFFIRSIARRYYWLYSDWASP